MQDLQYLDYITLQILAGTPNPICPFEGQIFSDCMRCPVTCQTKDQGIICPRPAVCKPGCQCQNGQIIDMAARACVDPEDCTSKHKVS